MDPLNSLSAGKQHQLAAICLERSQILGLATRSERWYYRILQACPPRWYDQTWELPNIMAEEYMISAKGFPNKQVPLGCGKPDAVELADLYSSIFVAPSSPNLVKAHHALHRHQSSVVSIERVVSTALS